MMLRAKVSEYKAIVLEFKGKVSLYPTRDETRKNIKKKSATLTGVA